MRGNSELPPGAQGIGDVLSHLCKLMIESVLTVPSTKDRQLHRCICNPCTHSEPATIL